MDKPFVSEFDAEPALEDGASRALAQHRDRLDAIFPDWCVDDLDALADPALGLLDTVVWWMLGRPHTEAEICDALAAKNVAERLVRLALGNLVRCRAAVCDAGAYRRLPGGAR